MFYVTDIAKPYYLFTYLLHREAGNIQTSNERNILCVFYRFAICKLCILLRLCMSPCTICT